MKLLGTVLSVLVLIGLASGPRAGEKLDKPLDKDFLVKVASCNNAEIEISKMAERRTNSAEIKNFANMIQRDHKEAYDKLGQLIKNRNVGVAAGLEPSTREEIKRLGKLEGNNFDRAFLDHMIREHKKAITIFENQASNGKEADIRNYAKELLPDLRKHLKKAEELAKNTGR
jgi:putative membrane protein